jgi:hypothetical protein
MSKITSVSRADYFMKHSGTILKFEFGGGWMPLFSALAKLLAAGYTFLAEFHLCVVYLLCPMVLASVRLRGIHPPDNIQNGGCPRGDASQTRTG